MTAPEELEVVLSVDHFETLNLCSLDFPFNYPLNGSKIKMKHGLRKVHLPAQPLLKISCKLGEN